MSGNNNKSVGILAVGAALIGISSAAAALYLQKNNRTKKNEGRSIIVSNTKAKGTGRKSVNITTTKKNVEEKEPPDPPRPRSQEEVYQHFAPLLQKEGTIHTKNVTSYARQAIQGEKVTTTIDGKQETQYDVKDDNSWLVCGKAAGEYYVLTDAQLQTNYDTANAKEISQEDDYILAKRLRQQGFLEYKSLRKVYARQVTQNDMDFFCRGQAVPRIGGTHFVAPWGELVYVEEGDYLVMQYNNPDPDNNNNSNTTDEKEIYRIECHVFYYNYVNDKKQWTTEGVNAGSISFPDILGTTNATIGVAAAGAGAVVVLMAGIILKRVH